MALPGSLPELVHLAINGGYGLQLIFCPGSQALPLVNNKRTCRIRKGLKYSTYIMLSSCSLQKPCEVGQYYYLHLAAVITAEARFRRGLCLHPHDELTAELRFEPD